MKTIFIIIIILISIGLPALYLKLEKKVNIEKKLNSTEVTFIDIMQEIGWPLLFCIYSFFISLVLYIALRWILIFVLLYLTWLIMSKISRLQKIVLTFVLFVGSCIYVMYTADYTSPQYLKTLQTKIFSNLLQTNYEKIMDIANSEFDKGNYDSAIKYYRLALKLNQNSSIAYYNMGLAKDLNNQDIIDAIEDYTASIELDPKFLNAYFNRGIGYSLISDFEEYYQEKAIIDYTKVIELDPKDIDAYMYRAIEKSKYRAFESALDDCDYSIKLDPRNAKAYFIKAFVIASYIEYKETVYENKILEKRRLDNSLKKVSSKLVNPYIHKFIPTEYKEEQRDLSTLYSKELKQILQNCTLAIMYNTNYEEAYFNRAIANESLKNIQKALDDYNKVIKINPNNVDAYFARINLRWNTIDLDNPTKSTDANYKVLQAIEADYKQIIKIEPNNQEAIDGINKVKHILKAPEIENILKKDLN